MDDVAGYRVLRSAGRGSRSRLLLGYDEGATVVLKACAAGDPRVALELRALARAAGEHVVPLLDVAADEHGTVLVLERLAGGSLADLLERRGSLAAGEAVTILAPIAATLERMHAAGVAHGALSLEAVLFRADGAPVLVGFGGAELFAPGAPEVVRETVPGVVADRAALRGLADLVLGRVEAPPDAADGVAVRRLARRIAEAATADPAQLAAALYATAHPVAVGLEDELPSEAATSLTLASAIPGEQPAEPGLDGRPVLPAWIVALVPDGWRERVEVTARSVRQHWQTWPATRRRLAIGLAAVAVTVPASLALVPASPATVASPEEEPPTAANPVIDALPEDPVGAAVLLLARREECLRDLSVLCLDAVVQGGSAAQADDVELVRSVLDGAEYPSGEVAPGPPVLVERWGDSALLDLPAGSEPASVLLLKTAEGWRLRQYLGTGYGEAPAFETGTR